MILYFARHGESEANILRVISNRGSVHGLTELGRQQAVQLAHRLREAQVSAIYSSPLLRAVETSDIVAEVLGLPYQVHDGLREYDCGMLEGRSDTEAWRFHGWYAGAWLAAGNWGLKPDGGESFLDIRDRFVPFVESVVAHHDRSAGGTLLIGHGGIFSLMLPLILDNVTQEFVFAQGIENSAHITAETTPHGLRCRRWCGFPM